MIFTQHSDILGQHAFLSASKYSWINYNIDKLREAFTNAQNVKLGTELHDIARMLIEKSIRLPKNKTTLNMYVNDAIGYRLTPEQPLYFSENCFGTADAIGFEKGLLRIHDLKTGVSPASMHQLEIYAALFCLEYKMQPKDISTELRIYQSCEVIVHNPPAEDISSIMDKIITFDKEITRMRLGAM